MRGILTFHSVDPSGSVLSIAPAELRSLVRAIRRAGHAIVPLAELLEGPEAPRRVALAFDDGLASVHDEAAPILAEERAPATVFVTTDYVGKDNRWPTLPADAPTFPMMRWEQVEALRRAGWEVEAHTATHPDLRALPDGEIDRELVRCDDALAGRLGARPRLFAYPYGAYDARVEARVRQRYAFALTAEMGLLPSPLEAPHRVPRLETFYFRSAAVHRHFGSRAFGAYLRLRAALRRLRGR